MLMFEKVYIFMTVAIADQIQTLENRIFWVVHLCIRMQVSGWLLQYLGWEYNLLTSTDYLNYLAIWMGLSRGQFLDFIKTCHCSVFLTLKKYHFLVCEENKYRL